MAGNLRARTHVFRCLVTPLSLLPSLLLFTGCGSSSGGTTSDPTADIATTTQLGAVTGLTVTPGDGQNRLTWDAVEGAVGYEVYWTDDATARSTGREADCSGDRIEGITGTSYTHTGLSNGMTYRYSVTALNGDGIESSCPDPSTMVAVTPTQGGGSPSSPVYGCNHPDATNDDPTVTIYVPSSCSWPTPTPTPTPAPGDTTPPTAPLAQSVGYL